MVDFLCLHASDPRLVRYLPEIKALIDLEARKLGVANPATYFAPNNEFMLAVAKAKLAAVVIVRRDDFPDATFLGYSLMITSPHARRQGLLARMTTYHFLRTWARILLQALRQPSRRLYIYSDVSTPVVYGKMLRQRVVRFYPDLVRGDSPAEQARAAALRTQLVERCGFRDRWQAAGLGAGCDFNAATGVIQDVGAAGRADTSARSDYPGVDQGWAIPWGSYVPPQADLLVVACVNPFHILLRLGGALYFGLHRRRQVAPATSPQPA